MKSFIHSRRDFLQFLGAAGVTTLGLSAGATVLQALQSCQHDLNKNFGQTNFLALKPSSTDDLLLAPGMSYSIVIKEGTKLNKKGAVFGQNNDYLAFFPLNDHEAILWVNHEYPGDDTHFAEGELRPKSKSRVEAEMRSVGGSLLHLKKNAQHQWELVFNSHYNKRFDAFTTIPLVAPRSIMGSLMSTGTFGNCAGGVTPWKTVLSCEENYQDFYGEVSFDVNGMRTVSPESYYGWKPHYQYPPEHYGWVVEIEPLTGKAKKLTALGRFAHECATVVQAKDGRTVVYMGDDSVNQFVYKFIAAKVGSLETGELFAADTVQGKWLSLNWQNSKILQQNFKDQLDVLIRARQAAQLLGATPQNRPEDIEVHPKTQHVYISMTNNSTVNDPFGHILKLEEQHNDPLSLTFSTAKFVIGGETSGLACPDNLAFDSAGNLWVCTDISGSKLNLAPYSNFKNNALFVVPTAGKNAGLPIRVATAPNRAEFTGPCFLPDGKTLLLSVQHPGEDSTVSTGLLSYWPHGKEPKLQPTDHQKDNQVKEAKPLSAVVAIDLTHFDVQNLAI